MERPAATVAITRSATRAARRPARRPGHRSVAEELPAARPRWPVLLAAVAYLLVACLLYWPVAPWDPNQVLQRAQGDPAQTVWYLQWFAWALGHGLNPLFTNYVDVPHGANIATNTSVPLLSVLGTPISWVAGPITTFNLAMRIGLAGSALSMFVVLRRWTRWWPAALLGGALYGFNSMTLQQSATHLHLTFLVLPPLILWAVEELAVAQRHRAVPAGVALGLLSVAQWFVNQEVLVGCVIFAVIGLAVLALTHPDQVTARARRALPGLLVAAAIFLPLVAYPLWFMLAGPEHLLGPTQARWVIAGYRQDLLGPLVPGISETSRASHQIVVQDHPPRPVFQWVSNAAYVGVPMLVALAGAAAAGWRNRWVRFCLVMAGIAFVLSLGGPLLVLGHDTGIPLPGEFFSHVPLLYEILPQRLVLFEWLFLAVLLAFGVQALHDRWRSTGRPSWWSALAVAAVVGCLVPIFETAPARVAAPVADRAAAEVIPEHTPPGHVVLFLPMVRSYDVTPMLWQALSPMRYRMVGGYVIVPRSHYASAQFPHPTDALARLWATAPVRRAQARHFRQPTSADAVAACRALPTVVRHYDVSTIVLWPAHGAVLGQERRALTAALGPAPWRRGGLTLWDRVPTRERGTASCAALAG